jgi:hypothetical protein
MSDNAPTERRPFIPTRPAPIFRAPQGEVVVEVAEVVAGVAAVTWTEAAAVTWAEAD